MKYIHKGDKVRLFRDIYRTSHKQSSDPKGPRLYAKEGTTGVVQEVFSNKAGAPGPYAKVLVPGRGILTFRLTSLTRD